MNISFLRHLRAVALFPFSVTVILPLILTMFWKGPLFPSETLSKGPIFFSIGLYLIGLVGLIYTIMLFHYEGEGTLAPFDPPKNFVAKGMYSYCRNPMIISLVIMVIAEAIFFNSLIILLYALSFFFTKTLYFIYHEEPQLVKRFGASYER